MFLSVIIKAKKYDPDEFETYPISSVVQQYLIFPEENKLVVGTITLNKEILENDDKFYSLGIFTNQSTFNTLPDSIEKESFPLGEDILMIVAI